MTRRCYYNTDCGVGAVRLRDANIKPPKDYGNYYGEDDIDRIQISVATADEEDGEPQGHFVFDMRVFNVPAKLSERSFDVDLRAYLSKDELKRLYAVFGLLLGLSET